MLLQLLASNLTIIAIDLSEKNAYASSVAIGMSQYSFDGEPKINVDSQSNADGI